MKISVFGYLFKSSREDQAANKKSRKKSKKFMSEY